LIDGFNRQFLKPLTDEEQPDKYGRLPQLSIPGFKRLQTASYVALKLPFHWRFWGLDTEVDKLDIRQRNFFLTRDEGKAPERAIIATSKPTTVFGRTVAPDSDLAGVFRILGLETAFLEDGKLPDEKCRLDLSGDVHHYARYWGTATTKGATSRDNYASVVSGLGGAFHHPSQIDFGEIEEQTLYPSKQASRREVAKQIFNFWNLIYGGNVWLFGALGAMVVYFGATGSESTRWMFSGLIDRPSVVPDLILKLSGFLFAGRPGEGTCVTGLDIIALVGTLIIAAPLVWYTKHTIDKAGKSTAGRPSTDKKSPAQRDALQGAKKPRLTDAHRKVQMSVRGLYVVLALLLYVLWRFVPCRDGLPSFACSMLVLVCLIGAIFAIIESTFYSEWLLRLGHERTINRRDYWPVWIMVSTAAIFMYGGVLVFGIFPAAYLLSDIVFAVVVLVTTAGLVVLAIGVGGRFVRGGGRVIFAALGLLHGVLQLLVPFLLVTVESLSVLAGTIALVLLFRKIGVEVVKRDRAYRVLPAVWVLYGALFLLVPFGSSAFPILQAGSLSQLPYGLKLVTAGLVGALMSCVWLGWYLAVSLIFNGHDNEAGGAARIERFKQFIRFRLRANELTGYVIAVDDPQVEGSKLKPRLVDVFTIKC
jgi:hypothetical protein